MCHTTHHHTTYHHHCSTLLMLCPTARCEIPYIKAHSLSRIIFHVMPTVCCMTLFRPIKAFKVSKHKSSLVEHSIDLFLFSEFCWGIACWVWRCDLSRYQSGNIKYFISFSRNQTYNLQSHGGTPPLALILLTDLISLLLCYFTIYMVQKF